jgi:glycerate 2-kinase
VSGGALDLPPPVFVVAAGKGAWPMASALSLDFAQGVAAGTRSGIAGLSAAWEWFDAAHPFSEAAGRRAVALAAQCCRAHGSLLVLLSGGASSMLAVPAPTLTLADKGATSRALMNAGAPIAELNCVRKHLSAIKGGRLAAAAGRTTTLALSDVHGPVADDPSVIGSGPTVADPTTCAEALAIVRRAGVAAEIPASVLAYLERGIDETPKPGDRRLSTGSYHVIGNRYTAMEGAAKAARARGYAVRIVEEGTSGEAREAGAAFVTNGLRAVGASESAREVPVCIIASGETTVHVRGTGRGGRNQEFALAAIPMLDERARSETAVVVASAGTDGIDGPTDAAGAIADSSSGARARRAGLDWAAALRSNGAYDFFAPLGDLLVWGPTGTNVGDVHVMLIGIANH